MKEKVDFSSSSFQLPYEGASNQVRQGTQLELGTFLAKPSMELEGKISIDKKLL